MTRTNKRPQCLLLAITVALAILFEQRSWADIDVTDIAGLYNGFREEHKNLSPVIGLLYLTAGVYDNIRFLGKYGPVNPRFLCHKQISHPGPNLVATSDKDCPQDFTTAIVQHFFPSPGGGRITVSNAKSDFFGQLSLDNIGKLLAVIEKHKALPDFEAKIKTALFESFKKNQRKDIGGGWVEALKASSPAQSYKELVARYAHMIVGAFKEAYEYPQYVVDSLFWALAIKRVARADELKPLLDALKDFRAPEPVLSKMNFSYESYRDFKKNNLQNQMISEENFRRIGTNPEELIFNTLAYEKYDNIFPAMLGTGKASFKTETFSDCGETSLRNFLNIILSDPVTRSFSLKHLITPFPNANQKLQNFYAEKQRKYDDVVTNDMRSQWANVVSGLNNKQGLPISYRQSGECNIAGIGLGNMLAILETVLNDQALTDIRLAHPDKKQQYAKILDYIFSRFSRDNFQLDWHLATGGKEIKDEFLSLIISINGTDTFEWLLKQGHFEFRSIEKQGFFDDWRKNDPKAIGWLFDQKQISPVLKSALAPFYSAPSIAMAEIFTNSGKDFSSYGPSLVYGSSLLGGEQQLAVLNMAAALNATALTSIAQKWIDAIPSYVAMNIKIAATVYNLQKHGFSVSFPQSVLAQLLPSPSSTAMASDLPISKALTQSLNNMEKITIFIDYPYADQLIADALSSWPSERLMVKNEKNKQTLLHQTARYDLIKSMKVILEKAPNLFTDEQLLKDDEGETPLHVAAYYGSLVAARMLIKENPNLLTDLSLVQNNDKRTPLHFAASQGHLQIAILLLEKRPELLTDETLMYNEFNYTPKDEAVINIHPDVAKLLGATEEELEMLGE